MKSPILRNVVLLLAIVLLFASCAPGCEKYVDQQAGFWSGLWHGFISFFTFIISLFSDNVNVYEVNNNGGWYNFGFILGISIFYGGSSKGSCKRK